MAITPYNNSSILNYQDYSHTFSGSTDCNNRLAIDSHGRVSITEKPPGVVGGELLRSLIARVSALLDLVPSPLFFITAVSAEEVRSSSEDTALFPNVHDLRMCLGDSVRLGYNDHVLFRSGAIKEIVKDVAGKEISIYEIGNMVRDVLVDVAANRSDSSTMSSRPTRLLMRSLIECSDANGRIDPGALIEIFEMQA